MTYQTECAVCGKTIEVTQDDFKKNTEPLCNEHSEDKEVNHG